MDWIFRHANEALARLESLWSNSSTAPSAKILYDQGQVARLRALAPLGETLEIIDHSPEIDTDLKIICFPAPSRDIAAASFAAENSNDRVERCGRQERNGMLNGRGGAYRQYPI